MTASGIMTLVVAFLALIVSLITLWRTHFAKAAIVTTVGSMQFRIHKISSGDEEWHLPHFAVPISFTNVGTQLGRVLQVRVVVRYLSLPIEDAHETFHCLGEFDPVMYNKSKLGRFEMIDKAMISRFTPFPVLGRDTANKYLVFSQRWDAEVRQSRFVVDVEFLTERSSDWVACNSWEFVVSAGLWSSLYNGSGFTVEPGRGAGRASAKHPEDLHKYTYDSDLESEVKEHPPSKEISPSLQRRRKNDAT